MERFWKQEKFWLWILFAMLLVLPAAIFGGIIATIITVSILIFWLRKNLIVVGTIDRPAQAIVGRFAKGIDVVGPGLYFILWPIEKVKQYPLHQYRMDFRVTNIHTLSKKGKPTKKGEARKPRIETQIIEEARITVFFRFPRIDREYTFYQRDKKTGKMEPARVSGKDLLINHTFYRLPIKEKDLLTAEALGKFLAQGVIGAVRHILTQKTHIAARQDKPKIEKEIKDYLLMEEGNPFYEIGTPKECLDIELTRIKFTDDFEKSLRAPEVARREKEAEFERIKADKKRVAAILEATLKKGGDMRIAQIFSMLRAGLKGRAMDISQVRDALLSVAMLGLVGRGKDMTKEDLKKTLESLSVQDLKKILEKIQK